MVQSYNGIVYSSEKKLTTAIHVNVGESTNYNELMKQITEEYDSLYIKY